MYPPIYGPSCGLWGYQICKVVFQDLPKEMGIKKIVYILSNSDVFFSSIIIRKIEWMKGQCANKNFFGGC